MGQRVRARAGVVHQQGLEAGVLHLGARQVLLLGEVGDEGRLLDLEHEVVDVARPEVEEAQQLRRVEVVVALLADVGERAAGDRLRTRFQTRSSSTFADPVVPVGGLEPAPRGDEVARLRVEVEHQVAVARPAGSGRGRRSPRSRPSARPRCGRRGRARCRRSRRRRSRGCRAPTSRPRRRRARRGPPSDRRPRSRSSRRRASPSTWSSPRRRSRGSPARRPRARARGGAAAEARRAPARGSRAAPRDGGAAAARRAASGRSRSSRHSPRSAIHSGFGSRPDSIAPSRRTSPSRVVAARCVAACFICIFPPVVRAWF